MIHDSYLSTINIHCYTRHRLEKEERERRESDNVLCKASHKFKWHFQSQCETSSSVILSPFIELMITFRLFYWWMVYNLSRKIEIASNQPLKECEAIKAISISEAVKRPLTGSMIQTAQSVTNDHKLKFANLNIQFNRNIIISRNALPIVRENWRRRKFPVLDHH